MLSVVVRQSLRVTMCFSPAFSRTRTMIVSVHPMYRLGAAFEEEEGKVSAFCSRPLFQFVSVKGF